MPTLPEAIDYAFQSFEEKDFDRAQWWCHQVLRKEPNRAEMLNLLGAVCAQTGRLVAAIGWYREAVDANPNYAEAYNNLGVALQDLGQIEVAIAQFEAAIALAPDYAQAYFNLGNALSQDGQIDLVILAYQKALRLDPNFSAARNNLAYLYQALGDYPQAIGLYRQSIAQTPDSAIAHINLANLLQEQGNFDGAMVHYEKASQLDPSNADLAYNLALAYQSLGDFDRAISTYYLALQRNSRHGESHHNLGALLRFDRPVEALAHLQQAITYQPDSAEAYNDIGLLWQDRMDIPAAIASFRTAIELDPDFAEAHLNLAKLLLLSGDYSQGFAEYEWRWQSSKFLQIQLPRHQSTPRWQGADLAGKMILLWAEQGLREALLWMRFVPIVKARGATVIVECDRQLVRLFQQIPGVDQVVAKGDELPKCEWQVPFGSLPQILGAAVDAIPNLLDIQSIKSIKNSVKKIGFAANDKNLTMLKSQLHSVSEIEFVELAEINKETDIQSLASTIAALDLVITLDSPIAHLAGNLGISTWVLLEFSPDWIWMCDRADSPWYPTTKLFRQSEAGNWEGAIGDCVQAIRSEFTE